MDSGDPFRLIDVLTKHQVEFVIIGGHAVTFHGYVRATEDTDIVIRRTPEGDRALFAALSEAHACWISDEIDPATGIERTYPVSLAFVQASHLMMLTTDFGFLDIFDFIPGHPGACVTQLFEAADMSQGRRFSSLGWLRRMKQAAGRAKDQLDLANLPHETT
jgi:hypothetical protein